MREGDEAHLLGARVDVAAHAVVGVGRVADVRQCQRAQLRLAHQGDRVGVGAAPRRELHEACGVTQGWPQGQLGSVVGGTTQLGSERHFCYRTTRSARQRQSATP